MNEKPDGSVEVVGHQCFDLGHILHGVDTRGYNDIFDRVEIGINDIGIKAIYAPMCVSEKERFQCEIETEKPLFSLNYPNYIKHTRIDRWTGLKYPDGRLVFERDWTRVSWLAELGITELDCETTGVIRYANCAYRVDFDCTYKEHVADEMDYELDFLDISGLSDEIIKESEAFNIIFLGIEGAKERGE
jgi:hypothetical protein